MAIPSFDEIRVETRLLNEAHFNTERNEASWAVREVSYLVRKAVEIESMALKMRKRRGIC